MTESSTADSTYFHTLTARPYTVPTDPRDLARLNSSIESHLINLPPEIRLKILGHVFEGNRVAVTARSGCYCASTTTGPYRAEHLWLLRGVGRGAGDSVDAFRERNGGDGNGDINANEALIIERQRQRRRRQHLRHEAQRTFLRTAMWEIHCENAMAIFIQRLKSLCPSPSQGHLENQRSYLRGIRHLRVIMHTHAATRPSQPATWNRIATDNDDNGTKDLETSLAHFPNLSTVTFSPWQKYWSVSLPLRLSTDDVEVVRELRLILEEKAEYIPLVSLLEGDEDDDGEATGMKTERALAIEKQRRRKASRRYKIFFVFPVRTHQTEDETQPMWQFCVWRANLDDGSVERDWKEPYLVQEATLD